MNGDTTTPAEGAQVWVNDNAAYPPPEVADEPPSVTGGASEPQNDNLLVSATEKYATFGPPPDAINVAAAKLVQTADILHPQLPRWPTPYFGSTDERTVFFDRQPPPPLDPVSFGRDHAAVVDHIKAWVRREITLAVQYGMFDTERVVHNP